MTKRTNSRITYTATPEGIKRAEHSLKRLGFGSKTKFAEVIQLSRGTVTKFFGGQSIELDGFRKICGGLELLDWKEIADIKSFDNNGKVKEKPNSCNQITKEKKVPIAISANISPKDLAKYKSISKLLKKLADDDFIEVVGVEKGSIKLTLKGSSAGLQRLEQLFQSGELTKIFKQELNITVENVSLIDAQTSDDEQKNKTTTTEKKLAFTIADDVSQADIDILKTALVETSDDEEIKNQEKSHLVREIITKGVQGQDLSNANLSGANLSGANLSNANLSNANLMSARLVKANLTYSQLNNVNLIRANLIGANLSNAQLLKADLTDADLTGAKVENARFGYNSSISESLKRDLITRGAIFEGDPNELVSIERLKKLIVIDGQKERNMGLIDDFKRLTGMDRQIRVQEWADANRVRNSYDMGPKNYQRCLYDLKLGGKYHELEWDEDGHLKYQ